MFEAPVIEFNRFFLLTWRNSFLLERELNIQKYIVQLLPISFAIVLFFFARLVTAEVCSVAGYPDQYLFVGCVPIEWNADNSATELGATATRTIYISRGQGPYTWTVSGNGFYLDSAYTKKSITTDDPSITLYTKNACGAGEVTITDACGFIAQGALRSINGKWVIVESPSTMSTCKLRGNYNNLISSVDGHTFEVIKGKYRLIQVSAMGFWGINCYPPSGKQGCDSGVYTFDPNNPLHNSCIDDFDKVIPDTQRVTDRCFWQKLNSGGYSCKRTYWAEHRKYLYEWKCN